MKRFAIVATLLMLASLATAAPVLAAPPPNDEFAGAISITLGTTVTQDTTEATTDAVDAEMNPPDCGAPATEASVWFDFTATADGFVAVDVSGSSYSAGVLVSTGSPGNFTFVTCGPGAVVWEAVAGETYVMLAIDDTQGGGNGGTLELEILDVPPPPEIDLTVNRTGRFDNKTGAAIISGSVTCTGGPTDFSFIDVFVRQQVGRIFIDGFGSIEGFECDGSEQSWTVEVFGQNGIFKGGKSLTATFALACGPFLCGESFVEHVIQLKGKK
jgi:hypothetical protein